MLLSSCSFGEDIPHLKTKKNIGKSYYMIPQSITNEVTINLNVLGEFMKDEIICNLNSISIIGMKRSMLSSRKPKYL